MNWKLQRALSKYGPSGLFLGTLLGLGLLMTSDMSPQGATLGFAEVESISIAPVQAGVLAQVHVKPGQWVEAGEVVASLDTSLIDEELRILQAERALIDAERSAEMHGSERQKLLDRQRLEEEVEGLSRRLIEESQELTALQAELKSLQVTESQMLEQLSQQLTTREELTAISLKRQKVALEVAERPSFIGLVESQLASAKNRLSQVKGLRTGSALEPIDGQAEVLDRRLAFLERRKAAHSLLAPRRGQIGRINHLPGEVLAAGQTVASLEMDSSRQVIACLNEATGLALKVGDKASLWPKVGDHTLLTGYVISVSPKVDVLPSTCQLTAEMTTRGRMAIVHLDDGHKAVPGQSFQMRFLSADAVEPGEAAAAALSEKAKGPAIKRMGVPEALKRISRLEPSAVVWNAALNRYILVSDDTGLKKQNEHSPWLFTMDQQGQLDEQPLAVANAEHFNDLESITGDGEGGYYLLSSLSKSRTGERSEMRTQLFHLNVNSDSAKVLSKTSLLSFLEGLSPEKQKELGLKNGTDDLDIEGMAFRDGLLYLGLKSPVLANGEAIVWTVNQPSRLLAAQAQGEDINLWNSFLVPALVDGKEVQGGISSLEFSTDGGLLITSTPSSIDSGSPTGRLWFSPSTKPQDLELTQSFPGLKPEGLALGPKGKGLIVVFDGGGKDALWARLP